MSKKVLDLKALETEVIVSELASRGYTVTAPKVAYKSTKLEYKASSVPAVKEHLNAGKKVRINFGQFKGKWIQETFSTVAELDAWVEANPVRKKYGKSFSLL
jgi:hypothetical protein